MSGIQNKGAIKNQIINPQIQGDLVVHGDVVMHGKRKIARFLTRIPVLKEKIIGREKEIERLRILLNGEQQVVLLNGLGGIGKTTIAIAYTNQFKDEYTHIVWLEQSTDFTTDLVTNTVLTQNLGINPTNDSKTDAKLILNSLSNLGHKAKSLLIIDNADEQLHAFIDFLPKAPNWHVLITSRQELEFSLVVQLGYLSEQEAIQLFYRHYDKDNDDDQVKQILQAVDFHTLIIELLAKTAQKRRITPIRELVELLDKSGIQINRKIDLSIPHSKGNKIEKLFSYLKAIFQLDDSISSQEVWLMKHFVGLPPILIQFDLLVYLLQLVPENNESFDDFTVALEQLKEKGWLVYDSQLDAYKMHRVVQGGVKQQLTLTIQDLEVLYKSISGLLYFDDALDNPSEQFQYIPCGEWLLNLFPLERNEQIVDLIDNMAVMHRENGNFERAKELFIDALNWYTSAGVKHKSNLARIQSNLAMVHVTFGDFQKAKKLLLTAIEIDKENFGKDHFVTATRLSNLAIVLSHLGDYRKALKLIRNAIDSHEKYFGKDHPRTISKYAILAKLLADSGEHQSSKEQFRKVISYDKKKSGNDHPILASRYSGLANVLIDLAEYKEAKELLQSAANINEANFGKNHPTTSTSLHNLAIVCKDLGEYSEAKQLLHEVISSDEKSFGKDHPNTAIAYCSLGNVLRVLGEYDEAKEMLELAVNSNEKNFGKEHVATAGSYSNLALILKELEEYEDAKNLLVKAITTLERDLGPDHPDTNTMYSNLASTLRHLGDYEESRKLLQKVQISTERIFGRNHLNVGLLNWKLAEVSRDQKEFDEMIQFFFSATRIVKANLDPKHPYVLQILTNFYDSIQRGAAAGNPHCIKLASKPKLLSKFRKYWNAKLSFLKKLLH